ncbi:hypothetical protein [Maioricimonas sp. JC845]|uniref:hypothetical protein n=1 Tax=Maioricimonas sp. JC845 TaxID=3232138 RepID=UPI00345A15F2
MDERIETIETIQTKMLTESGRVVIVETAVDTDVSTPDWHCHSHRCTTDRRELLKQPLKDDPSAL